MRTVALLLVLLLSKIASADVAVEVSLPRTTYWRGETVRLDVRITSDTAEPLPKSIIRVTAGSWVSAIARVPNSDAPSQVALPMTISTKALRSGQEYPLKVELVPLGATGNEEAADGSPIATTTLHIFVARKPDAERLDIWQWLYGGPSNRVHIESGTKADDLGITVAGGPVFPYSPPGADPRERLRDSRPALEDTMKRGMGISICPVGIWYREYKLNPPDGSIPLVQPTEEGKDPTAHPDDDTRYRGASRNGHSYFNPFHPAVARAQTEANELMMEVLGDFPNLNYAFVDAEWIDDLRRHNANAEGLANMQRLLGFTPDEIGKPQFVAPRVVADDDRGLRYRRYVHQYGTVSIWRCNAPLRPFIAIARMSSSSQIRSAVWPCSTCTPVAT